VKKIPLNYDRNVIAVTLSDPQWNSLFGIASAAGVDMNHETKEEIERAMSEFLSDTFNYQKAINPAKFTKPFTKIITLTDGLMSVLEDNFFPLDPKNRDPLYNDIISRRMKKKLFLRKTLSTKRELQEVKDGVEDDAISENELKRRVTTALTNQISISELETDAELDYVFKIIYELNALARKMVEKYPSAKGEHGNIFLHPFLKRIIEIYQEAGGRGPYIEAQGLGFTKQIMTYVADFAKDHISQDQAAKLAPSKNMEQLKEQISKARKPKRFSETDNYLSIIVKTLLEHLKRNRTGG
jgi:hypothetical protein